MKKFSILLGLIIFSLVLSSCGKDDTTIVTPPASTYFFESDSLVYRANVIGESHIYFQTPKKNKIVVDFTGETDAGNTNFDVTIEGSRDSVGGLVTTTLFKTSTMSEINKDVHVESPDLSQYDPLVLTFRVSITRPTGGVVKYVKIKNIKAKVP